jgi:TRAP-type C4-dicarboxylate transport system substrate-binding protein
LCDWQVVFSTSQQSGSPLDRIGVLDSVTAMQHTGSSTMDKQIRIAAMLIASSMTLAACVAEAPPADVGDRVGSGTAVLRFATIDGDNSPLAPGVAAFIDALEAESDGALRIEITYTYANGAPDAESRIVEAIASGDLDGGWPSTRAFNRAGIPGLDAIEAPMTLTSYAALKALTSGPAADRALASLDGSGVVGLGLAVGDLRRPLAANAFLLTPDDWEGISFRAYNSPVQTDAIEALGATARDLSFSWDEEVAGGRLQGIETGIGVYAGNSFSTQLPFATANVVLWPKVHVLAVSQQRLASFSDEQRGWVDRAVEAALAASAAADYDESSAVSELCAVGVRFAMASDDELAAMREAVQPVIDGLASSEADEALMSDVLAIAAEHPNTDVPTVPESCLGAPAEDPLAEVPDEISALPDGQYRAEIRLADLTAAGVNNGPGWTGTWTLAVEDGTYVLTCRAVETPGKDCGNTVYDGALEAGNLLGRDDVVYFVFDEELMAHLTGCELPATGEPRHCYSLETYRAQWSIEGDRLTFTDAGEPTSDHLTLTEWQKID